MKNLALIFFFVASFLYVLPVSAQNDEPYYNNRDEYKKNGGETYTTRISTNLARPFYRDICVNAEKEISHGFTMLIGVGMYLPRTYSLKPGSFEDKTDIDITSPGFRILTRGYSYLGDSFDDSFGAMEFAYNSLGDVKFLELGMCLGVPIKLISHFTITPEFGFGARMFTKNPYYQSDSKFPVPYIIADISFGYNF